jgi:hypothetical protein
LGNLGSAEGIPASASGPTPLFNVCASKKRSMEEVWKKINNFSFQMAKSTSSVLAFNKGVPDASNQLSKGRIMMVHWAKCI